MQFSIMWKTPILISNNYWRGPACAQRWSERLIQGMNQADGYIAIVLAMVMNVSLDGDLSRNYCILLCRCPFFLFLRFSSGTSTQGASEVLYVVFTRVMMDKQHAYVLPDGF